MSAAPSPPRTPAGAGAGDERPRASAEILDALTDLRRDVDLARFPLRLPGVEDAERRRTRLLTQLDDHLLPRMRELSAPAVVVVAGSTGAGKSTLVNSVLGTEVSRSGVLRPTTRRPVLVHHPGDGELLAEHPLLEAADVVVHDEVPRGLVLLDAPDLDSLLDENRATARRLLDAADLWLFVTTAARYGDAVVWQALEDAAERGTAAAVLLNRVPADALTTVRADLLGRLREHGLTTVPLFVVPDQGPHEGLLGPDVVAPLRRWLVTVAGPGGARAVVQRTQRGAVKALRPEVESLADAVQAQVDARAALETAVRDAVEAPADRAVQAVRSGAVADGPVRARWVAASGRTGPLGGRWNARRAVEDRAAVLADVRSEVLRSATVVLEAARRYGENGVVAALASVDLPGAADLGAQVAATRAEADPGAVERSRDEADAWAGAAVRGLEDLRGVDRSGAARLERQCGTEGAVTLLLAAAAGLGAARVLLSGVLGTDRTQDVVGRVADDLLDRVRARALSGADRPLELLHAAGLPDDAASRLRLRLAVLKRLP